MTRFGCFLRILWYDVFGPEAGEELRSVLVGIGVGSIVFAAMTTVVLVSGFLLHSLFGPFPGAPTTTVESAATWGMMLLAAVGFTLGFGIPTLAAIRRAWSKSRTGC